MTINKTRCLPLIIYLTVFLGNIPRVYAGEAGDTEGGFVGETGIGAESVVWGFIKHFSYERYQYTSNYMLGSGNNSHIDDMDIAYFCGHGNYWQFTTTDTVDYTFNYGWGDDSLDFAVFYSCCVVPSNHERSDWYTRWYTPFNGLHQVLGFRNPSYESGAYDVSSYFGNHVEDCGEVLSAWWDANHYEGSEYQLVSMTYYPLAEDDTYCNMSDNPPHNSNWFYNVHDHAE